MNRSIDEKLTDIVLSEKIKYPFIFRVHQSLRKHKEESYEPEMISIGPYHHGKPNLKKLEKYKLIYLQGILKRRNEPNVQRYIAALRGAEKEARNCYEEDLCHWSRDDFVDMMLLDGCFIIEFLRKRSGIGVEHDDPIFSRDSYHNILFKDLLLFENQLPFFIIQLLFDMTKIECKTEVLIDLATSFVTCFIESDHSENNQQPENQIFHLLHIMHDSWCSNFFFGSRASGIEFRKSSIETQWQVDDKKLIESIKSASELKDYGIKFKKGDEGSSWLDIKFENGIIYIPTLMVDDSTEPVLRNLIAYEQYHMFCFNCMTVVTDYATFMDRLINSTEDVKILRQEEIITNWLGSDKEISNMFNKIGNNVILVPHRFSYWELFKDVNEHCKKMNRSIDEKLADVTSEIMKDAFISRVHPSVRKHNEEAYEPEMISIGPYHHGKLNLKKPEKYKLIYLQGILKRRNEPNVQRYIAALRGAEKEARNCYEEDLCHWSQDDFVDMMLLDGCFIIEFLRKLSGICVEHNDPIFSRDLYHNILFRDLLLFENQLPFFILQLLFDMTMIEGETKGLIYLATSFVTCFIESDHSENIQQPENQVFHLLNVLHNNWLCKRFFESKASDEINQNSVCCVTFAESKRTQMQEERMKFIKSASELEDYGIKFKKATEGSSWLDIKFENGIIYIPTLMVEDDTESILRNLIAYEQCMVEDRTVVIDYTSFMDYLINSSKDVQILRHKEIITNLLGSDEDISNMFNKIGNGVNICTEEFSYRKLFEDVNKHCIKRRNTWITDLKRTHFYNPWSIISFLVAILLLLLTLIQTIFTILSR